MCSRIGRQRSWLLKIILKTSRAWSISMLVYIEFASAVNKESEWSIQIFLRLSQRAREFER